MSLPEQRELLAFAAVALRTRRGQQAWRRYWRAHTVVASPMCICPVPEACRPDAPNCRYGAEGGWPQERRARERKQKRKQR